MESRDSPEIPRIPNFTKCDLKYESPPSSRSLSPEIFGASPLRHNKVGAMNQVAGPRGSVAIVDG